MKTALCLALVILYSLSTPKATAQTGIVITNQPQSLAIPIGGTATFAVGASSESPLFSQWQRDGTNVPDGTSTSLNLFNVTTNDIGSFRVIVSNLSEVVTSVVATLSVYPSNMVPIRIAFSGGGQFTLNPTGVFSGFNWFAFSSNANVQMKIEGDAGWKFWQVSGGKCLPSDSQCLDLENSANLQRQSDSPSDTNYTFGTTNTILIRANIARLVTVSLKPLKPRIALAPQNQFAPVGTNVTLSVAADGLFLSYRWYRNGNWLFNETGPSLVLSNVQDADSGEYTVEVSNEHGNAVSQPATLTVYLPPTLEFSMRQRIQTSPHGYYTTERSAWLSPQGRLFAVNAGGHEIFVFQGTGMPLCFSNAATFTTTSPFQAKCIHGDQTSMWVTFEDGSIEQRQSVPPFNVVTNGKFGNYGAGPVEAGPNGTALIGLGQCQFGATTSKVAVLQFTEVVDLVVEFNKNTLTTNRVFGRTFDESNTLVFNRTNGQLLGKVPKRQYLGPWIYDASSVYLDNTFLMQYEPSCCGGYVNVYDATTTNFTLLGALASLFANCVAHYRDHIYFVGTETGRIEAYDLADLHGQTILQPMARFDLRQEIGVAQIDGAEVRGMTIVGDTIIANTSGTYSNYPSLFVIDVHLSDGKLREPQHGDGMFTFSVSGNTNSTYIVQASTNLSTTNWVSVATNTAPFTFSDMTATNSSSRFYRALKP